VYCDHRISGVSPGNWLWVFRESEPLREHLFDCVWNEGTRTDRFDEVFCEILAIVFKQFIIRLLKDDPRSYFQQDE
jgi:hypothetical protein